IADVARSVPGYLLADKRDRGALLRAVYKRYAGAPADELDRLVDDELADEILARAWPAAIRRIRDHRAAGHRTVLLTGAIRPLAPPLRRLARRRQRAPGPRHRADHAAAARDEGRAASAGRRLGAGAAAAVRHLRQRPHDTDGPVVVLLLPAGVDAVRPRARGRRRAPRRRDPRRRRHRC